MYSQYQQNIPPKASVGAVNIQIYNPTVSGNGQPQSPISSQPMGMPGHVGQYYPPAPYYYPVNPNQNNVAQNVNQTVKTTPANSSVVNNSTVNKEVVNSAEPSPAPIASSSISDGDKPEKSEKKKKKEIVQLTDSYIKTLENYLRNPNAEVRLMGTKELLKRFKEEKTRKNDIALTNLLNLTLQDPSSSVRMLGLATLSSGYALGDKNTVQLLKQLQKSDNVYNQDALLASQVLLKMSGKKIDVVTDEIEEPKKEKDNGSKLDVLST